MILNRWCCYGCQAVNGTLYNMHCSSLCHQNNRERNHRQTIVFPPYSTPVHVQGLKRQRSKKIKRSGWNAITDSPRAVDEEKPYHCSNPVGNFRERERRRGDKGTGRRSSGPILDFFFFPHRSVPPPLALLWISLSLVQRKSSKLRCRV